MKYSINLFPSRESQLPHQIYEFIAYYLRYALVISLFVVIVVFFLRMQVDRKLADEKEKLILRKSIIEATQALSKDLQQTQRKVGYIKSIVTKQEVFNTRLTYFLSTVPKNTTIQTVVLDAEKMQVEGISTDYRIIQLYIYRLQQEKKFETVKIENVNRDEKGVYRFSLTLTYPKST